MPQAIPQPTGHPPVSYTHLLAALAAIGVVGHYGAFTFIVALTERSAPHWPGGLAAMLISFGIATALGVAAAGRVSLRTMPALIIATATTSSALLGLGLTRDLPVAAAAVILVWGMAAGALPTLAQTQILRTAGTRHRSLAGALIPVLFNLSLIHI